MRARVLKALRPLDAIAVENMVGPGTPDVSYIGGWIELKSADRWPPRGGPLRLDHFTKEQRAWIRRHERRGGRVDVLLRVGREWILLPGGVAASILGDATRSELIEQSCEFWSRTPSDSLLLAAFSR